jgi:hypothetical protein
VKEALENGKTSDGMVGKAVEVIVTISMAAGALVAVGGVGEVGVL